MQNSFTQVTKKGYFSRILNSIGGIFFGIFIFFVALGVLFWNEGKTNISKIAEQAIQFDSTVLPGSELSGQLISVTGNLTSEEVLGDTYLQVGNYLKLFRNVEMYSWIEEKETTTQTNTGGSETTTETFKYTTGWTQSPQDSSTFKIPEGHTNPALTINNLDRTVNSGKIGEYNIRFEGLALPTTQLLELNASNILEVEGFTQANENYLFNGQGTFSDPEVGDLRISYTVLQYPLENVTAFGSYNSIQQSIEPFFDDKNNKLFRVLNGNFETAINTMQFEHTALTWGIRIGGLLAIWIAFNLILSPISTMLDILPIFGKLSRTAIGGVTFLLSLIIWITTIIVSMIANNIFALIISLLLIAVAVTYFLKKKYKPKTT